MLYKGAGMINFALRQKNAYLLAIFNYIAHAVIDIGRQRTI
jgi:hypothetical protein